MKQNYTCLKWACYTTNVTMAIVTNLPPILFLTFRTLYGISYTLLGLLVLINFSTQLMIDLIFSFFSHRFDSQKTVKITPVLGAIGLIIYAFSPFIMPNHIYFGLSIGTIIFSSASGFAEVLISPVIASIPVENPDREMSKLHSVYAWGAVGTVVVSTLFLLVFGGENWQWLTFGLAFIPLVACVLFNYSMVPKLDTPKRVSGALDMLKNKTLWLFVVAIFIGGASECTMAQWCSAYLEKALNIPKVWGDMFGVALFGIMLGLGRTLYAKIGKNIERVLLLGSIGATACYLITVLTNSPIIGLLTCGFTGLCTSMLWPGNLVVSSERIRNGGVFLYAMMAAGGDLGAAVGPQLVGVVTDLTWRLESVKSNRLFMSLTPAQLGMKCGLLTGMLFPLVGIGIFLYILKTKGKNYE